MNIFKKPFVNSSSKMDEQTLIAEIHNEFDSAQDRLLLQARKLINDLQPKQLLVDTQLATRLERLGFVKTPVVSEIKKRLAKEKEANLQVVKTKEEAELIEYYKFNYPFLKFLTEQELNRICNKYHLIYAPVENYTQDVPEKNLGEIESSASLKQVDATLNKIMIKYPVDNNKYMGDEDHYFDGATRQQIKELKRGIIVNNPQKNKQNPLFFSWGTSLNLKELCMDYFKINFNIMRWDSLCCKCYEIKKDGLYICAPRTHFDLSNVEKVSELSYHKTVIVPTDPIVFRYCRGGVQVLSKWGHEANDESLLNEINN